ncbi:unnamed protein product [Adineta steineri]|nr:unnamed protein product [Adineta steineri]
MGPQPRDIFINTNNTIYVTSQAVNSVLVWHEGNTIPIKNISGNISSPIGLFVTTAGEIYVDSDNSIGRINKWTLNSTVGISIMYTCTKCYDIFIDMNNNLYCSMKNSHQIVIKSLDVISNALTIVAGTGNAGSTSSMLSSPYGIYVNTNFDLYVADYFNNRIQLFQSGQLNAITVAGAGSLNTTIALNGPTGIVLDADNYLYIVDCNNNRIVGSGPNGFRCLVGCSGLSGSAANQLTTPKILSFDSYGETITSTIANVNTSFNTTQSNNIITLPRTNAISYNRPKFDASASWSANAITFADSSTVGRNPWGIYVDTHNSIYAVNSPSGRIQIWLNNSISLSRTISGNFLDPHFVFVTINGDIYIDNGAMNGRVDKWVLNGNTSVPVMYVNSSCWGLFIDINNTLYCALGDQNQVVTKSLNTMSNITTIIAGTGCAGSTSNMLYGPYAVYVNTNFDLYVADRYNDRIQLFRSRQLDAITIAGDSSLTPTITLDKPMGIALDADNYIFIVDNHNHRIVGSGPNGFRCLVGCSTQPGSASNQLNWPQTFGFDSYGNIFVTDCANNRVQKFILLKNTLDPAYNQPKFCSNASWYPDALTFTNISTVIGSPLAIFVNTNDTIYVADRANNEIRIWFNNSIDRTQTIHGNFSASYSIFVTTYGDIYVDNGALYHRVDKWTLNGNTSVPVMYVNTPCYGLFVDTTDTLYCSMFNFHQVVKRWLNDSSSTLTTIAVILIVIDALRYDFIKPNDNLINSTYLNQMPFIKELLKRKSKQSVLFKLIADPPTTTLQRLKALTTGTLPTFIDVSYNFIGYEIEEDNILNQLKENSYQRNISLLGDDTWLALYPNIPFKHLHVYPSFDVHDLDTVDNGILKHLWTVIEDTQHHQQLSFIIAHFLGVDHCGHRYGPLHIEMKRKLNQMDEVIRNITLSINKSNISSLLMIIGDHGMTQQGDHGGDELNEIETAMFLYTNKPNYFSLSNNKQYTVSQIDLVPTLSWFLHTLIPFSNIGMMIIDVIPKEQRYLAMKLNFEQMEIYLKHISLTLQLSDKIHELRASLHTIFITFDRERNLTQIENLFNEFKFELQTHFRRQWSTFNIFRIVLGLIIMLLSCIILLFIYFEFSKKSIDYKNIIFTISLTLIYFAISFSNSFIINEAICLYFLIQTIILITKMNIFKKFLLSFLLFLTRIFLICREEQQPYCIDPLWLLSKSSDTSHYFLPFMASIAWFIILILSSNYSYISYIIIVAYWFNISHTLSIFYLSVIIQFCFVLFKPSHIDTLIYSILIFVVGYRFSFVIFLQYFIYYIIFKNNKNNQSLPLLLSLLADYFFYATGHQPVLSQIRWTAAFPTINTPLHIYLSSIINSLFVRGVFVLIETFSGQILNIILIRKMIPKKYQGNLLKHILIVDCFKLLMTSLSVFILRRHLMLWKIFSPRFLFQLVGFIIKCLFVFLTMKLQK